MIVGVFLNISLSLRQWDPARRFNPQDEPSTVRFAG